MKKPKISSFSVIMVFILLFIIGIGLVPLLNVQFVPSRTLPRISLRYFWPRASAKVVEQKVTAPLEGLLSTTEGLKKINSVSRKGSGEINLSFKKSVNLDAARLEVATLVRQGYEELPEGVSYPLLALGGQDEDDVAVLSYSLNASASPFYVQKFAEDQISPKLALVDGVSGVRVYGATPYQWEIEFDADLVHRLNISGIDIARAVNNYFRKDIIGMGNHVVSKDGRTERVRVEMQMDRPQGLSWSRIPVKKTEGRIVYLTDIAQVRYVEGAPDRYYRVNGLNAINIVVYPEGNSNILKVADKVSEKIKKIEEALPVGYGLLKVYDATQYMSSELEKILFRTVFSIAILLVFVLLTSRQWRYLLLITISLIANVIIAFIFYYFFQLEIHLYSLAGITVSFGLIIDNSIVMIDHLRHHGNRKVFLAILAAILTTMGSVLIVFLLEESQQVNLIDFAQVIVINMGVSLVIAYFLIPALFEKIGPEKKKYRIYFRRKRRVARFSRGYAKFIRFNKRFRWAFVLLFVLGFGLPVHWLPEKLEDKNSFWAELYNNTMGAGWYNEVGRPWANKILGGSLRLFTENVFSSSFYSNPQRTVLYVRGEMPEGCTVQQLNEAILKMENYISQFNEVEKFQTQISSYRNSSITIHFKQKFERSSFPYYLKSLLESKAISLGGLDWSIYGVGRGFSNALGTGFRNSVIKLIGYNYDQLYSYGELLKENLLKNQRIKEVDIQGTLGWNVSTLHEYYLDFNLRRFGLNEITLPQFHSVLKNQAYVSFLRPIFNDNESQPVTLVSNRAGKFDVWELRNEPIIIEDRFYKMTSLASIEKRKTGNDIYKINQQYQLVIAYDFIGPHQLGKIVMEREIGKINSFMGLGYKAEAGKWGGWQKDDKKQYLLIFVVILTIFFICSILLESLLQSLAVISLIPISFIGVFLTFYFFAFNFDQGGFASFILLSGIVVNAALYIINDYNNYRKSSLRPKLSIYLKAYNSKIIPVGLTVISTILGLVPFVWMGQKEVFWFAFAVGSIGGLLFSMLALLVYLPLFLSLGKEG